MTKREAAIIELYTGICMLTGDDHFNPLPRKEGDF